MGNKLLTNDRMRLKALITAWPLSIALAVALLLLSPPQASGTNTDSKAVKIRLLSGSLPIVTASMGTHEGINMLLDTGANRTTISAELLGMKAGESFKPELLCVDNGPCFQDIKVMLSDSPFTMPGSHDINGILGMDAIGTLNLTIDYKNEVVHFRDTLEGKEDVKNIPIIFERQRPFAALSIHNMHFKKVLLDTGSLFLRINQQMHAALSPRPRELYSSVSFNYIGSEKVKNVLLESACLENACQKNVYAQVAKWVTVGGTFFRNFITSFNFEKNIIRLKPYADRGHIVKPFTIRTGMQVNISEPDKVVYVEKDSPAWMARIRQGSHMLSINDVRLKGNGILFIASILEDPEITKYTIVHKDEGGREITSIMQFEKN